MLLKNMLLTLIGFTGGGFVAAGIFAFITLLGIVPRMAGRTGTAKYILLYENMIILGGAIGNFLYICEVKLTSESFLFGSQVLPVLFGIFAGIFVGCQAMALAEVLQVIPVFSKRVNLKFGLSVIILAIALGKMAGSIFQLCFK